jgi:hypothetical protein
MGDTPPFWLHSEKSHVNVVNSSSPPSSGRAACGEWDVKASISLAAEDVLSPHHLATRQAKSSCVFRCAPSCHPLGFKPRTVVDRSRMTTSSSFYGECIGRGGTCGLIRMRKC